MPTFADDADDHRAEPGPANQRQGQGDGREYRNRIGNPVDLQGDHHMADPHPNTRLEAFCDGVFFPVES